jgi:hypothetical protein
MRTIEELDVSRNKPEPLSPPYTGGRKAVGNALRAFFLGLLEDENLYAYHQNRVAYINRNVTNREARRLLKSADFVDIEKHILAVDGSARAKPLFIVCPPY